jgi:hypothetical protein
MFLRVTWQASVLGPAYSLGFPGALSFNAMNKFMFNIGVFPISMTGSLALFINVWDLRKLCNRVKIASNIMCGTRQGGH